MTTTETVLLEDILTDVQSGFASGERVADGVVQVRMNNVTTDGNLDWSSFIRVPTSQKQIEKYQLLSGDILFNSTNSPELVGKTTIFDRFNEPVVFSNHFVRMRVDEKRVDSNYLARWFLFQWQNRVFQNLSTQWVNQAAVRKDDLLELKLSLPPMPEQHRIADLLSLLDRLRRLRRFGDTLSASLLQSLFLEMFGDPKTNPHGYEKDDFEKVILSTQNGFGQREDYSPNGTIVLRIRDISSGEIDYSEPRRMIIPEKELVKYTLVKDDLIVVRVNGNPNFVGIASEFKGREEPIVFSDHVIRIRLDKKLLNTTYVVHVLNSPYGRAETLANISTTAGQFTINSSGLSRIKMFYPPLPQQEQFAAVVRRVESLRARAAESKRQIEGLFQALLAQSFGEA